MRIPVKHDRGGYDIILERGALIKATEYLPQNCRTLVVTDSGVPAQYARAAAAAAALYDPADGDTDTGL